MVSLEAAARLAMALPDVTEGQSRDHRIPHFDGYPAVLIQLNEVGRPALRDVILDGWLACAPRKLAEDYDARRGDH